MIATLIIILILLAATAAAFVYRRQQKLLQARAQRELQRQQRPPRSLFAETQQALEESAPVRLEQPAQRYMEQRAAFMTRATEGDLTVLTDAQRAGDAALYRVVLNGLVERAARNDERLQALAAFVANDGNLRGSVELAEAYSTIWQQSPDRAATATMLQLAALSDDADTFRKAIEIATLFWQSGQMDSLKGEELRELIDSQYWLLSAEARRTGAGFVLKQKLASLRAELARAAGESEQAEDQAVESDGV